MDKILPRYRAEVPAEEIPARAEQPELLVCRVVDGKLILPRDLRQQFLSCPIFGQEWREILQKFDKDWGTEIPSDDPTTPPPRGSNQGVESTPPNPERSGPVTMPNEPETLEKLKEKYGEIVCEMPVPDSSLVLALVTGPCLFLVAKAASTFQARSAAIIAHGAGSWLTADKATAYEAQNPGKGIPCSWTDDQVQVVLEDCCY